MKISKFVIYNKNAAGVSVVTALDTAGTENVVFGTSSITQSRKALAQYKKENNYNRVPQDTKLDDSYDADIKATIPSRETNTAVMIRSIEKRGAQTFGVNHRFNMLAQVTRMIASGHQKSQLITGIGGTGKTYTVFSELEACGFVGRSLSVSDDEGADGEAEEDTPASAEYFKITGAMSPLGLYRTLYENSESILVFDDCDSILTNPNAVNILKAVLDTSGDGTVSWVSPAVQNAGMPTQFSFTGHVIFISNKKTAAIPQPLLSRSLIVDMDMDKHDILERAKFLDKNLLPKLDETQRAELFKFVSENLESFRDVSLRLFVLASPFIECGFENWRDLVLFTS